MPSLLHLTPADARRAPWKNGRGVTQRLALSPGDASFEKGDFDWRVSTSSIVEPGPFSEFPGFDRVLVVTQGDGLLLDHGGRAPRAHVKPLVPYCFSGDWPTTSELHDGPVVDFNVLVRRDRCRVGVHAMSPGRRPARVPLASGEAFVHVIVGPMIARSGGDGRLFLLAANDSLRVSGGAFGDELQLVGTKDECTALLVHIGSV